MTDMAAPNARVVGITVCDGARLEVTNKLLLVGVYSESFSVYPPGGPAMLTPVLVFTADIPGTHKISLRLSWPGISEVLQDGGSHAYWSADLKFDYAFTNIILPLPAIVARVIADDFVVVEQNAASDAWVRVARFPIILRTDHNEENEQPAA